ncbi:phosphatidylserine decarboxylase proenzyme [Pseudovibrio japonicus]|uniref:Phosphatidylserine decarboxylase proenzyme n=1 Tax=Pseudovibrio japonicus TaxID=366534 RepID=A0ABQ3DXB9_9HYPH|nr:phosphatidylserine decarboxylase [Pseudovibrio japonicus]GHB18116.1 phosphatidylserine decarboxylase proenzyme [Pseudovibrio japonicus]
MSLADSISKALVPIHKEGYPFIAIAAVTTIILGWFWSVLFWIGLFLTGWVCYFFRDPPRVTPVKDGLIVSPADGTICQMGSVVPPRELDLGDQPMMRVGIFLSVFNCHVNRAPMTGRVTRVAYKAGKFVNAELDKASEDNERNGLIIENDNARIGVVQIAGLVARRIVCFVKEGENISVGDRFGLIRFGSRLDVYLPHGTKPQVALGQTMIAGESVLANLKDQEAGDLVARVS